MVLCRPERSVECTAILLGKCQQSWPESRAKSHVRSTWIQREDDISETIASGLLNKYIETIEEIEKIDDIYDDYISLFEKILNFIVG